MWVLVDRHEMLSVVCSRSYESEASSQANYDTNDADGYCRNCESSCDFPFVSCFTIVVSIRFSFRLTSAHQSDQAKTEPIAKDERSYGQSQVVRRSFLKLLNDDCSRLGNVRNGARSWRVCARCQWITIVRLGLIRSRR